MKKHTQWIWRVLSLMLVYVMAFSPAYAYSLDEKEPPEPESIDVRGPQATETQSAQPEMPALKSQAVTEEQVLAKFYPSLLELVKNSAPALPQDFTQQEAASQPILVTIIAAVEGETKGEVQTGVVERLRGYFIDSKLVSQGMYGVDKIAKEQQFQLLYGKILPYNLLKVAWDSAVLRILPIEAERNEVEPYPADDTQTVPGPKDWAELRANAENLRAGSLPWSEAKVFGDGRKEIQPLDWFEMTLEGPAKAEAAWLRGFQGQGVAVSVIDDGVDFAHPDIMGAQKIYSSTVVPQYNGWPMVMDPFSMRAYFYDLMFGTNYIAGSFGGVTYIDTSETPAVAPCGVGARCFTYTPMIDFNMPGFTHTYIISPTMTKSNVVHVGTHVDESLRDYVWGEKVAVLVTDPNTAGVYDTVYVDLDDDYDFRDEKPLRRANPANPATYNNMIAYRDMNGDGLADLSGGMLYYIADGVNFVPAMDWLFVPVIGYGLTPPGNGDLIAIHGPWDSGYSHGTQCASNVIGNGTVDGLLPEFRDLAPGPGTPAGAVFGAAPAADLVPMNTAWSFTGRITYFDAYMLAAVGWDGVDQTGWHMLYGPGYTDTDAIQITSNSYGWSADFNDGWDILGQYVTQIQRYYAPYLQFLFSTGNGGPGYGTATPPSPDLGIAVGASTEYGSTGWDTITDTNQIMYNDAVSFSNAGPSARAGAGVDVLAGGAYAAGSEELNYYSVSTWGVLDGNLSWASWGGTSRSSPTAMGVLALIYQAYKAKHGVWPTASQAKALLMSSATDINNDVFKQGAGAVNADRGTLVANGLYGVYANGDSYDWTPGDYRGTTYPGFAQVVEPGDTWNKTFTLRNDSATPITVGVSDAWLQKVGEQEESLDVTPAMMAGESAYGAANRDNFYKAFNYFIPITAQPGNDASWYNITIPANTDLMVIRQIFPYDEFDVNGNYAYDNRFYLIAYNWKDINGNGTVWTDKNDNGVVNFINGNAPTLIDYGSELVWDDPRTELERWEYGRFDYNRPSANVNQLLISDPLGRMHDGLFLGLRHLSTGLGSSVTAHLKYRFEFYHKVDVPWLSTSTASLAVPAGGTAAFNGTIHVPADMPAGDYSAAIEVLDPGSTGGQAHTTIIPVAMNVAADFSGGAETLGGQQSYAYDQGSQYNNGAVRGYFDWSWREESGDWRAFYLDINNNPIEVPMYSQNFDGAVVPALPADWSVTDVSGTAGNWATNAGTVHPSGYAAHSAPNLVFFNSYTASSGNSTRLWRNVGFNFSATTAPAVKFWMFHDGQYSNNDTVQVQVSTNGGSIWTNVGAAISRYVAGTYAWQEHTVDLSAYVGQPSVLVGFLGTSAYGNDCHLDDIRVVDNVYPFPPDAHVIVKDEWADAAPNTDIDTVALGPQPTSLSAVSFGVLGDNWAEPPYFGPYVLNTVGQSTDVRSGRAVWNFNTTSGGNQDWISFPLNTGIMPQGGGLFELMQHNVLFEGDQFNVVFTKTVGLLKEDEHSFDIDTYMNQGQVGQVHLESTIPLSGLVGEAFLLDTQIETLTNEPLPFTGAGSFEWTRTFSVVNGEHIYLETSSANISDLDLFLFHWDGSRWVQVASSAGATAAEAIDYAKPPDGDYQIAIDNYSGPAGTFNLYKEISLRVPGLSVVLPSGPIPANTPVLATINYNYPFEPGKTYDGMVYIGTPEGPRLKEIPVTITRLVGSAGVSKVVDFPIHFPADGVLYTIDLFNKGDASASFNFVDKIPAGTTFVNVSGWLPGTVYSTLLTENFDAPTAPALPAGWAVTDVSGTAGNWATATGTVHPSGQPPHSAPNLAYFNSYSVTSGNSTRLYRTAPFSLVGSNNAAEVRFWMYHDTGYTSSADRVEVQLSTDGTNWMPFGSVNRYTTVAGWAQHAVDISAYLGQPVVYLGLLGISGYGNDCHIDDVSVAVRPTVPMPIAYNPGTNAVVYTGPLNVSPITVSTDYGFNNPSIPSSWIVEKLGPSTRTWTTIDAATYPTFVHSGSHALWHNYDGSAAADSWLYSPAFVVSPVNQTASFWAFSDTLYPGATVKLWVVQGSNKTLVWDLIADENWTTAVYRQVSVDLSTYTGDEIQLAWQYVGLSGESFGLDDVHLPVNLDAAYKPVGGVSLTVSVDNTVQPGSYITNTAVMTATHTTPLGLQTDTGEDDAAFHIGMEDLSGSRKEATAEAGAGDIITYTLYLSNSGDALAVNVQLIDPLPAGTTYDSHDPGSGSNTFNYNSSLDRMEWMGNLGPNEELVFHFWVTVDDPLPQTNVITNTATVEWNGHSLQLSAATGVVRIIRSLYLPIIKR